MIVEFKIALGSACFAGLMILLIKTIFAPSLHEAITDNYSHTTIVVGVLFFLSIAIGLFAAFIGVMKL